MTLSIGTTALIVIILFFFFFFMWGFRLAAMFLLAKGVGQAVKQIKSNILGGSNEDGNS